MEVHGHVVIEGLGCRGGFLEKFHVEPGPTVPVEFEIRKGTSRAVWYPCPPSSEICFGEELL